MSQPPVTSPLPDSPASTLLQSFEVGIGHEGGGVMYSSEQTDLNTGSSKPFSSS